MFRGESLLSILRESREIVNREVGKAGELRVEDCWGAKALLDFGDSRRWSTRPGRGASGISTWNWLDDR